MRDTMARMRTARSPAAGSRLLAATALAALLGGFAAVVIAGVARTDGVSASSADRRTTAAPKAPVQPKLKPRPAVLPVALDGLGAYDPEGDGRENDELARAATDGDPATAWRSEHYRSSFHKAGVGLVLDAGRTRLLTRVVVTTETPGFRAQVQVGPSAAGPFRPASPATTIGPRTTLPLRNARGRYVMLWITSMPAGGVAYVDEIAAQGPRG